MDPAERARALASLFREAQSAAIHPAGCACGGMFRPALDAAGLEADLLDYLVPRYQQEGLPAIGALLQSRLDNPRTTGFGAWLRDLAAVPLADSDRDRLLDDLQALLDQMVQAARPSGQFACL